MARQRQLIPLRRVPEFRLWTTERLLRRMVSESRIAYHRINGRILIDLADLDAYAEGGRVEARGEP